MNCADVNDNTVGKPTTLEGLETTRSYVSGQRMLGSVVDEASGYYNHKLDKESSDMMGYVLFGYVFEFIGMVCTLMAWVGSGASTVRAFANLTCGCPVLQPFGWRNGMFMLSNQ